MQVSPITDLKCHLSVAKCQRSRPTIAD
jgi:hypothetical protein